MSRTKLPSLKDAGKCSLNRAESNEQNIVKSPKFSSLVLLAMNLKKSPWFLSRCKKTVDHVQLIQNMLKEYDSLKVIVKLMRNPRVGARDERYLVLISSMEKGSEETNILLGVNVINNKVATVGLILPITMETDICLDGDGGFLVSNSERKYSFQPVSIQEMWSALQALIKCVLTARSKKHPSLPLEHYRALPRSGPQQIIEWERISDALSSRTNDVASDLKENFQLKMIIRRKLPEILINVDLETVTSREIRDQLEEKLKMKVQENLGMSPSQYNQFIDEETILVMRQMDSPSQILDFLFLGSEWNASNFEELKKNRIGCILNITKEIENFFPGMFKYCNVQVYDYEETELLKHWNNTFKFISEARKKNMNVLVHCKMGISRSASTVIAFVMKFHQWSVEQAYQFVKQRRSCIQPNPGFMQQLITYQGILDASNHRHNKLFRSRSISSLDKVNKTKLKKQKPRPKSNTEERKAKEVDEGDGLDREENTSTIDLASNFIIVDRDDDACRVSESCISLDDHSEVSAVIDQSTLSTSSVLRQWSSPSSRSPQTTDSIEDRSGDVPEDVGECSLESPEVVTRRSLSLPGELDSNSKENFSMEFRASQKLHSSKSSVRFSLDRKNKAKKCMKRHHSMFAE